MKNILILIIAIGLSGCDPFNDKLSVTNKTKKRVSILYSNDIGVDTTTNDVAFYVDDRNILMPDSALRFSIMGDEKAWHYYIDEGKPKRLFFAFFDTETVKWYENSYTMNQMVDYKLYFKLDSYTENELEKMGWNVVIRDSNIVVPKAK
jgi:hypothetical protein